MLYFEINLRWPTFCLAALLIILAYLFLKKKSSLQLSETFFLGLGACVTFAITLIWDYLFYDWQRVFFVSVPSWVVFSAIAFGLYFLVKKSSGLQRKYLVWGILSFLSIYCLSIGFAFVKALIEKDYCLSILSEQSVTGGNYFFCILFR